MSCCSNGCGSTRSMAGRRSTVRRNGKLRRQSRWSELVDTPSAVWHDTLTTTRSRLAPAARSAELPYGAIHQGYRPHGRAAAVSRGGDQERRSCRTPLVGGSSRPRSRRALSEGWEEAVDQLSVSLVGEPLSASSLRSQACPPKLLSPRT